MIAFADIHPYRGPCAWVLISEVWPLSNRAYGIAIGELSVGYYTRTFRDTS